MSGQSFDSEGLDCSNIPTKWHMNVVHSNFLSCRALVLVTIEVKINKYEGWGLSHGNYFWQD